MAQVKNKRTTVKTGSKTTKDADTPAEVQERYQAFIRNSSEGIWRIELEKPIDTKLPVDDQIETMYKYAYMAEANDAMAQMYGLKKAEQIIGVRLTDLFVRSDPKNAAYLKAFINAGYRLSGVDSHERDIHGKDKYFRNSLIGIIQKDYVIRAWGTQQDVTQQLADVRELKDTQERLSLALSTSKIGIWEWNVATSELVWTKQLKQLFGLEPEDKVDYERYMACLHPDDRKDVQQTIQQAMSDGKEYELEHRVVWSDGSAHTIFSKGQAFMNGGKAVRMIGSAIGIDDMIERRELEKEAIALSQQRAELIEINQAKDEFISLASHQLRTPSTGVKQYIGMLMQGYAGELSAQQIKLLKIAYENNERQLNIIEDLLRVARVDAGKVLLKRERTDIAKLLDYIVQDCGSLFEERHQTLVYKKSALPMFAQVDGLRLRMAIENLIDNSSKYTPQNKKVSVSVTERDGAIKIRIADQGVGIPAEQMKNLFQKFSRVENPLSTLVGGSGLGLYWAKKIVDLHGGTISAVSRPEKGSTFTITLPKQAVKPTA